ncbi:hypothetical protein Taro_047924 [Colocasia esculenta]|uniref:Uncharacterized protein n=1 Tax=Colocasia esculenta TaxID=4460 RepID=A0A843X823_COLES|nr:hypothetical protein [Colocasia esculenta]
MLSICSRPTRPCRSGRYKKADLPRKSGILRPCRASPRLKTAPFDPHMPHGMASWSLGRWRRRHPRGTRARLGTRLCAS